MAVPHVAGVVIPSYNCADFVAETVASVLAQTTSNWLAAVVDDGSLQNDFDRATAAANGDARFSFIRQTNQGSAAARNRGAAALRGRVDSLLFLDADDVLEPLALEALVGVLVAHPDAVASYGAIIWTDERGLPILQTRRAGRQRHIDLRGRVVETDRLGLPELFLRSPINCPGSVLVRSETFFDVGGFDPTFRSAEDLEIQLRWAQLGDFVPTHTDVIRWRRHSASKTANYGPKQWDELRRLRSHAYRNPRLTESQRRGLRQAWRRHNLIRAAEALGRGPEAPGPLTGRVARASAHLALTAVGRPVDLAKWRRLISY